VSTLCTYTNTPVVSGAYTWWNTMIRQSQWLRGVMGRKNHNSPLYFGKKRYLIKHEIKTQWNDHSVSQRSECFTMITCWTSDWGHQWSNCKTGGRGTLWRAREREPIMGEQSPWSGSQGMKPPRSWRLFCFWTVDRPVELVVFSVFHSVQCGSVSESHEICHPS